MANFHKPERQQEMFKIVELWQNSKMSKKELCLQKQINQNTFEYWVQKYKKSNTKNNLFVKLVTDNTSSTLSEQTIELQYPNGVTLKLPPQTEIGFIQKLINF